MRFTSVSSTGTPAYVPPQTPPATGTNTFTDTAGTVWVSVNGSIWKPARDVCCCRCYPNVTFGITSDGQHLCPLGAATYDPLGMLNAANAAWQIPITGRYLVLTTVGIVNTMPQVGTELQGLIAGGPSITSSWSSVISYGTTNKVGSGQGTWPGIDHEDIVYLTGGQYLFLTVWTFGGGPTVNCGGTPDRSHLAVAYLGP